MKKELQDILAVARELQDKYAGVLYTMGINTSKTDGDRAYDSVSITGYVVSPDYAAWQMKENDFSFRFYSFDSEDKMLLKLEALFEWFNGCEELKEKLMGIGRPKTPAEYEAIITQKNERIEFLEGELELERKQPEGGAA